MIEFILGPFDWLLALPIERLFHLTTGISLSAFCFAAILRELFADRGIRWAARMLGVGAIFVSVCFGSYATHRLSETQKHIAVEKEDSFHHGSQVMVSRMHP